MSSNVSKCLAARRKNKLNSIIVLLFLYFYPNKIRIDPARLDIETGCTTKRSPTVVVVMAGRNNAWLF